MEFGDSRLLPRFWNKVAFCSPSGCWLWTGALSHSGYGNLTLDKKQYAPHRLAWVTANGPVPTGLEIDHRCMTKACCNPEHMEAVTHLVNMRRRGCSYSNGFRTHCKNGHEMTDANAKRWIDPKLGQLLTACRACQRAVSVREAAKRKRIRAEKRAQQESSC